VPAVSLRRTAGWLAMACIIVPGLWLVTYRLPDAPLPFVVMMIVGVAAIVVVLGAAYQVRNWIDPEFDPPFSVRPPR
jgi:hypothetical protein